MAKYRVAREMVVRLTIALLAPGSRRIVRAPQVQKLQQAVYTINFVGESGCGGAVVTSPLAKHLHARH